MNSKKLLVALAMPMLFAACSQEELVTVNNVKTDLSDRKVIANVGLNLDGVNSRLSVQEGGVYAAQWDANDGVGACIIDIPLYDSYPSAEDIEENGIQSYYDVQNYISSNYKYSKGEDGAWTTQALMVEGHYMFYAPHSENFITRKPVVATFPAEQNVDPTAEIRNSSIQEFYQSGAPVVVGYDFLEAANQDAVISPKLYNIFGYPKFTLKNSYKDENGVAQDLTISKIVIRQAKGDFITKAYIDNKKVSTYLSEGEDGSIWTNKRIETAATSDILTGIDAEDATAEEIVVTFGEGLEVAAGEKEEFFIVLPAEDYRSKNNNNLVVDIYTADNMVFANSFTMKSFVLNPGNAYPSEEYNTITQTLKSTKGTLATIDMKGTLIDLTSKNTGIKNNEELINYITNVAKRFDDIREVNDAFATSNTHDAEFVKKNEEASVAKYYYQYNPQMHFTLHKDAEIIINDELIEVLIDQLGDATLSPDQTLPEITFLGESLEAGKIKLGDLTKFADFAINFDGNVNKEHSFKVEDETYVWYTYLQNAAPRKNFEIEGNVTLSGELAFNAVNVPAGSTLTLAEDLVGTTDYNSIVINGGTVNYEGADIFAIYNYNDDEVIGTLNMNVSSEDIFVYNYGQMNVKGGNVNTIVKVGGFVRNYSDAIINNAGILANVSSNYGTINVTAANAQVTVSDGVGTIVNNALGNVKANQTQDVMVTLTGVPSANIAVSTGINHIIFTNDVTLNNAAWGKINKDNLKVVEFNGNLITPETFSQANTTFIFNTTAQWGGNEKTALPEATVAKVVVAEDEVVKVNFLKVKATEVEGELVEGNNGSIN